MHKKILIVVDDTEVTRPAIAEGLGIAKIYHAEVVFYYALPPYVIPVTEMPLPDSWTPDFHYETVRKAANKQLAMAALQAKKAGIRSAEVVSAGEDPAESISNAARTRKCDLIVIGSHGRTALQRLLFGSVVTKLITLASVPVLVCKKSNSVRLQVSANAVKPKRSVAVVPAKVALARIKSNHRAKKVVASGRGR
ncbi:MAG: universal stress protein [Betaproteobacteria bacterium]